MRINTYKSDSKQISLYYTDTTFGLTKLQEQNKLSPYAIVFIGRAVTGLTLLDKLLRRLYPSDTVMYRFKGHGSGIVQVTIDKDKDVNVEYKLNNTSVLPAAPTGELNMRDFIGGDTKTCEISFFKMVKGKAEPFFLRGTQKFVSHECDVASDLVDLLTSFKINRVAISLGVELENWRKDFKVIEGGGYLCHLTNSLKDEEEALLVRKNIRVAGSIKELQFYYNNIDNIAEKIFKDIDFHKYKYEDYLIFDQSVNFKNLNYLDLRNENPINLIGISSDAINTNVNIVSVDLSESVESINKISSEFIKQIEMVSYYYSSDYKSVLFNLTNVDSTFNGTSHGLPVAHYLHCKKYNVPHNKEIISSGEVDKKGNVHFVDNIIPKILGANYFGFKKILVPSENQKQIEKHIEVSRLNIQVVYMSHIEELADVI